MIYLKATNTEGAVIINSFPSDFIIPKEEEGKKVESRYLRKKSVFGSIEFLLVEEYRVANSNKTFNAFINAVETAVSALIAGYSGKAKEMVDDYLHNVIKIHGNQKSIIERCVVEAEGQENYNDFVLAVQKNIERHPKLFAEDICALSKEIRLVDYHIGGYNLLRETTSRITITDNHNLKKFLLGLTHLFFESLKKSNVVVSIHNVDEKFNCSFEYETFNIAMHSFIENMVKYAKPYSKVECFTLSKTGELIFEMDSIRIEKDEIKKIFERGVSGQNVPEDLRGKGIGMYQLKKALSRSNISFEVLPNLSKSSNIGVVRYTKNTFKFRFPKYSTS